MRFLKQALKKPQETGAVLPSSLELARLIVEEAHLDDAKTVVELGPGTGVFTEEILRVKKADTTFLAIEINDDFTRQLQEDFPERAIYHGSATDIKTFLGYHDLASCDRVISGIPWTFVPLQEREEMIAAVADAIDPGGLFLTFAYFPLNHFKPGRQFKEMLGRHFSDVRKSETVIGNIPPAFVYICTK